MPELITTLICPPSLSPHPTAMPQYTSCLHQSVFEIFKKKSDGDEVVGLYE